MYSDQTVHCTQSFNLDNSQQAKTTKIRWEPLFKDDLMPSCSASFLTYLEPLSLSTNILFTPHWPHESRYEHSNCRKSYPCNHHQNRFKRKLNTKSNNDLFAAWYPAAIYFLSSPACQIAPLPLPPCSQNKTRRQILLLLVFYQLKTISEGLNLHTVLAIYGEI